MTEQPSGETAQQAPPSQEQPPQPPPGQPPAHQPGHHQGPPPGYHQPGYQAGHQQGPPPGYQPGYPPPPYKRLTRTSWDSPISGVCGGVARYFGVDPTLVRVLAVVGAVFTFPVGPIVYAVLWAVIPQE